jgi:general secretion pathway protein K
VLSARSLARARARGVALITALLVVAIAALSATALLSSANLSIHRTAALRDSEQAWWVARGVQAWVLGILAADARDNNVDHLGEPWAQPVDHLPVDHGFVRGQLVDAQGLFNLNNLAVQNPNAQAAYQQQFERLLAALPAGSVPPGLVAAIRDWTDPDQTPGFPSGAEDTVYLSLDPPYRAANQRFTVVSELLAVQGMSAELYGALRPLLIALPAETAVNVNTAPEAVLMALSAQVDTLKLRGFIERRREQPAESVQAFMQLGIYGADVRPDHISVNSRYFQIQGEAFVGSSRVALYSLIHRPQNGAPLVLAHSADAD